MDGVFFFCYHELYGIFNEAAFAFFFLAEEMDEELAFLQTIEIRIDLTLHFAFLHACLCCAVVKLIEHQEMSDEQAAGTLTSQPSGGRDDALRGMQLPTISPNLDHMPFLLVSASLSFLQTSTSRFLIVHAHLQTFEVSLPSPQLLLTLLFSLTSLRPGSENLIHHCNTDCPPPSCPFNVHHTLQLLFGSNQIFPLASFVLHAPRKL
jgi:hypothetical protein